MILPHRVAQVRIATRHERNPLLATGMARVCDTIGGTGYPVVLHTVVARLDGSTAQIANRNSYNQTIRSWVGQHCDAICDIAGDATLATDTAPNNTTYFADKIHPTAAGHAL